ncbi:MAG: hypothetical protein J4478_00510 [Candidatus Diapherotrites archaeon]|uniref:Uncharacterized protein n=1 Tax=Candidatus Iainarchaeum sp. TaxID=3101447 RepID=A0A7J4KWN2_9ARCH|nr:hypothetical protein [Candidatus Diapherotrites archaeon]HIH32697.1 hypothetical protein [Candidatus Diapherotrites archaeon]
MMELKEATCCSSGKRLEKGERMSLHRIITRHYTNTGRPLTPTEQVAREKRRLNDRKPRIFRKGFEHSKIEVNSEALKQLSSFRTMNEKILFLSEQENLASPGARNLEPVEIGRLLGIDENSVKEAIEKSRVKV